MVSALIDEDTKRWKVDTLKSSFLPFEVETILNIPLSHNLPEDKIIWVGNNKGVFSVKSAYYVALAMINSSNGGECSYRDPRTSLWKRIWQLKIPPKIRIFLWKVCVNALPTMSNLRKRGVSTDGLCPVCGLEEETILHALCRCMAVKEFWRLWKDCQIDFGAESLDFSDIALKVLAAGNLKDLEILFVVAWAIWHNKNIRVFESVCQGADQIWNSAVNLISDFKEADKFYSLGPTAGEVSWRKPPNGVFKINTDGATVGVGVLSSIGVIIRDCRGQAAVALCRVLPSCFTMDETEALAVEAGILLARELDLQQIIIESDSLAVVQRISSKDYSGGFGHIVNGIVNLLDGFAGWQIRHVKRDFNRVAHELAKFARCNNVSHLWRGVSPPIVRTLMHLDCM